MQKVTQAKIGGSEVLVVTDFGLPVPKPGEVQIRIRAAGVNPVDVAVRNGMFPLLGEPPFTVGWDLAGEVTALGQGVTTFKIGDDVFGMPRFPAQAAAYAEFATAPANELVLRPKQLSVEEAGSLPLAGLTAWQGLVNTAGLKAGQKVLIHAGAGGVGHLAVQIAKALGAKVTASSSAGKLEFLLSIGAQEAFDYAAKDFTTLPEKFDVVFDPISGEHAERSLKVLKAGGTLVCLLPPSDAAVSAARASGIALHSILVKPDADGLRALAKLATEGKLKVHLAKAFTLAQAGAAQDFLATHPIGKIVIKL